MSFVLIWGMMDCHMPSVVDFLEYKARKVKIHFPDPFSFRLRALFEVFTSWITCHR